MLNQTAEYALRAVIAIAGRPNDDFVRAAELSAALGLPANYLSKILHRLAAAGILESRRGRNGGFRLTGRVGALSLARVVAPFDSVVTEWRCVLGGAACSDRRACAAHERWSPISAALRGFLRDTTVAEVVQRGPRNLDGSPRIAAAGIRTPARRSRGARLRG